MVRREPATPGPRAVALAVRFRDLGPGSVYLGAKAQLLGVEGLLEVQDLHFGPPAKPQLSG